MGEGRNVRSSVPWRWDQVQGRESVGGGCAQQPSISSSDKSETGWEIGCTCPRLQQAVRARSPARRRTNLSPKAPTRLTCAGLSLLTFVGMGGAAARGGKQSKVELVVGLGLGTADQQARRGAPTCVRRAVEARAGERLARTYGDQHKQRQAGNHGWRGGGRARERKCFCEARSRMLGGLNHTPSACRQWRWSSMDRRAATRKRLPRQWHPARSR